MMDSYRINFVFLLAFAAHMNLLYEIIFKQKNEKKEILDWIKFGLSGCSIIVIYLRIRLNYAPDDFWLTLFTVLWGYCLDSLIFDSIYGEKCNEHEIRCFFIRCFIFVVVFTTYFSFSSFIELYFPKYEFPKENQIPMGILLYSFIIIVIMLWLNISKNISSRFVKYRFFGYMVSYFIVIGVFFIFQNNKLCEVIILYIMPVIVLGNFISEAHALRYVKVNSVATVNKNPETSDQVNSVATINKKPETYCSILLLIILSILLSKNSKK